MENKVYKISVNFLSVAIFLLLIGGCVSTRELQKKQLILDERNLALEKAVREKDELEEKIELILSDDIRAENILKFKDKVESLESLNAELRSNLADLQKAKGNLENRLRQNQNIVEELKQSEQLVQELNEKIELLSNPLSTAALDDWLLAQNLQNSIIVAQDDENTYLGLIDFTGQHSESIFNEYGSYGSEYSSSSIWNEYGTFGSEYSSYSPFNEYTSTPPMLVKNKTIIGHLTENEYLTGAVSVKKIKTLYERLNE